MGVAEIDKIYQDTKTYVESLEKSFLEKHLTNQLASPDDYDYDVRSYCILCHAALEDYAENVSLKVLHYSIENYKNHHHLSESLITLMHFKSFGGNYFDKLEEDAPLTSIFDYTREALIEIKSKFSKEIIMENHGASLKYIRKLFMPVAIDIPNDPNILNSLKQLANERGFYAHKFQHFGTVKKSIEPEKAKKIVTDCMTLCLHVRDKAKQKITI